MTHLATWHLVLAVLTGLSVAAPGHKESLRCPDACAEGFWTCIVDTTRNECNRCVARLRNARQGPCPKNCAPQERMSWLCPGLLAPRVQQPGGFALFVLPSWIQHNKGGHKLWVSPNESLSSVTTRAGVRLGAPLGAEVTLQRLDGTLVLQVSQLQAGVVLEARVVVHEIRTPVVVDGRKTESAALGCDRCVVTNQQAPEHDSGTFTPSASRLGLAVLGNLHIYPSFWTQMRRVLSADNANLRIDKFKSWHSIRRIPLYACRGWSSEGVQCLRDLYSHAHNRTYSQASIASAMRETRRGHTQGTWKKCELNITLEHDQNRAQIATAGAQLGFACDVADMARMNISVIAPSMIVEFGAGYGGLGAFIKGLGFRGKYVIYDFEELKPVQEYLLSETRLDFSHVHEAEDLAAMVQAEKNSGCLFIAMWSLSEMPMESRAAVVAAVSKCSTFIVKSQAGFIQLDNVQYFEEGGPFRSAIETHGPMVWVEHGGYQLVGHRLK